MNFKDLVEKVKLHSGFQGDIASVEATDYTEYLAEAVRSAWIDLQLQREDWKFMWEELSFTTDPGVNEYSNSDLMTAVGNSFSVAKWKKDSFLKNTDKMYEIEWEYYRENEAELKADESNYFVIKEYRTPGLILFCGSNADAIQAEFYRTPQELINNTDIPILPEEFHYIIVYRALEDVAAYLGNSAIYERHSWKHDVLENKLMRSQVPHKKITKKPIYRARTGYQAYRSN